MTTRRSRSRAWLGALVATAMSLVLAPGVAQADSGERCPGGYVALTFDDGPTEATPEVLKALRDAGSVRSTFFLAGGMVKAHPQHTRSIAADGHEIANHSYSHPDLNTLTPDAAFKELRDASRAIKAETGRAPTLFRPPYGSTNPRIRLDAARLGMLEVLWTVDSLDWRGIPTDEIVANALRVRAGGIVLLHEGPPATIAAIPKIVEGLEQRGMCAGRVVFSAMPVQAWPGMTYHAKAAPW
ncbi:polysaccharide deacetylase family protein [Streptomyces sp. NPDC047315]|uniref:polysaccharide deacetylase family protein n=1 Tax=Streptomyces sp. NPDC047315 TaxID=3155142 RepID=UPI0033C224B1